MILINWHLDRQYRKQRGVALLFLTLILVMASTSAFLIFMDSNAVKNAGDQKTSNSLFEAKAAIIGDAVSKENIWEAGYLRLPDIGHNNLPVPTEGNFAQNFSGNSADVNVLGKFPWKGYRTGYLMDGAGECLWYAVSGRFKISPQSNYPLNWDTLGQLDIVDGEGNIVASNLAALVISPGTPLENQNRQLSADAYRNCRGNYEAKNYLDPFNAKDSLFGSVNYFSGVNDRVALNTSNTTFVFANNLYNDRFLYITVDEIFKPIIKRSDFSAQISALMDNHEFNEHLKVIIISGGKGTDHVNCEEISDSSLATFCKNWKEMLLLDELPPDSSIEIDGLDIPCNRVLIFGGTKTGAQLRGAADISDPANYLEGVNLTAFRDHSVSFNGNSTFGANESSADILKCL